MKNSLVYFVDEIRTPFVINDIRRVAERYEKVYLFSVDKLEGKEALPENVLVFEEFIDWKKFKPLKTLLANFFSVLGIYLAECFALRKILPPKPAFAVLVSNIYKAESVIQRLKIINHQSSIINSMFYSFWFYDCIYLAWLKKKRLIGKAVTRAHGGDLFEERGSLSGKILFRHFQLKYIDNVFSVSKAGTTYLQDKYSRSKNKISTVYLGSKDAGLNSDFDSHKPFVLVSCARVRNIKRIHEIAEMLLHIDFPLTWYHIGDENLKAKNDPTIPVYIQNKEKLKENSNITFVSLGEMNNQEVMEFYRSNQVNLFISLSEAEGVPVSIMEAISFGIPVLSTDVGGCREIVNEQTGILIPLGTEMEKVAQLITEFKNSSKNTPEYRAEARKFWEENFDAEKVYEEFFEELGSK